MPPKMIVVPVGPTAVACMKCGWCCEIMPCPLRLYLYGKLMSGPCDKLVQGGKPYERACGLVKDEPEKFKSECVKRLINVRGVCTHRFGPHPVRTLENIVASGALESMELLNNYFANMVHALRHAVKHAMAPKDVFLKAAGELAKAVELQAERFGGELHFGDQITELITMDDEMQFGQLLSMMVAGPNEGSGHDIRN